MCLWRLAFGSHSLNTSTKSPWLAALRTGAIISAAVADPIEAGTVEAPLLPQPMASRNKQKLAHYDVLSTDNSIQSDESVVHTAEDYERTQGGSTCVGRLPGAFPSPVASDDPGGKVLRATYPPEAAAESHRT